MGAHIEEKKPGEFCLMRGIPEATNRHQVIDVIARDDHRMAMAFSLLASKGYKVGIDTPDVVAKSYPDYWNDLKRLGMRWQP
jgi:3-phosphoshikimate 1-carboxyvinyltransferase